MSILATNQSKEYAPIPEGTHIARIYQIVHIGTIQNYMGEFKNTVRITFELPEITREFKEGDGLKPMSISRNYTLSTHEKSSLRQLIEAVWGTKLTDEAAKSYEVTDLIGKACFVTVKHKAKAQGEGVYANITTATPLHKSIEVPAAVNSALVFDYDENYSEEALERMPSFVKEMIQGSVEFKVKTGQLSEEAAGDVPF